jgi:hypothetical protein
MRAVVAGAFALTLSSSAVASELQRIALVMGSNDGGDTRVTLRYADTDAAAFASVLTELGGVDPFDVILISDPARNTVEQAMDELATRAAVARQAGRRVEVIVYYSGHSNVDGLLPRGELLPYSTLRARLSTLDADVKVSVLDSCASGALIRTKGGVRRPPFLIDQANVVKGEAFLTSSTADEASQESDAIAASFFTHHLVTGLRGAADADQGGLVTLGEAYRYTFRETRASTENSIAGPQNPNYALDLVGQGDLVLTDLRTATSLLVLDERLDGELWIRAADGSMLAEIDKRLGEELSLSVPSGDYRVLLQARPTPYLADIYVENGVPTRLTSDRFLPTETADTGRLRGDAVVVAPTPSVPDPFTPPPVEPDAAVIATPEPPAPRSPVGFQVVPGLGSPARHDIHGFTWGMLVGAHNEVYGGQIAGLTAVSANDVRGAQMAAFSTHAGGRLRGFQGSLGVNTAGGQDAGFQLAGLLNVAGAKGPDGGVGGQGAMLGNVARGSRRGGQVSLGFNAVEDHLTGAQVTGLWNHARGEVSGLQLSAGGNWAGQGFEGVQLSGAINIARGMRGAQIALINSGGTGTGTQIGLVNSARQFRGLQLGLINVAKEVRGESLGLLSFVGNGYHAWEFVSEDASPITTGFKFGSRHLYSVILAGFDPMSGHTPTFGGGFGGHVPFKQGGGYFDVDALIRIGESNFVGRIDTLTVSLRTGFGVRFGKHFGLIFGPTVNFAQALDGGGVTEQTFMPTWQLGTNSRLWIGYQAGINVQF